MSVTYLSPEWLEEAALALATADLSRLPAGEAIRFGYTITEVPKSLAADGSVRYSITLDASVPEAKLEAGTGEGDVRFTMSHDIAHSVATGLLNGSKAFLNGEVQVGGDVALLISRARELAYLDGLMPKVTNTTSARSENR
ncbi:MAG: hypothetical protein HKN03_11490 [Acidimicrobiales bacterium]|nr:hypothetical protein [Acidimicrobiales bacterium]